MRIEITVPDPLYTQAQRAATEMGVSLDRFFTDAMKTYLIDDEGPEPTSELIASLRQAEADIDAGQGLTMIQVEQSLAARKAEWRRAHLH